MRVMTFGDLLAVASDALNCDRAELAPCETQALVEAFEGGGGEGAANLKGSGTVEADAAAQALERFALDLMKIAEAIA